MTLFLTLEQTYLWQQGNWAAWEVEETILEDLEQRNIHEPVIVKLASGEIAFAVTPKTRMPPVKY